MAEIRKQYEKIREQNEKENDWLHKLKMEEYKKERKEQDWLHKLKMAEHEKFMAQQWE